jgi:hypothetical protein
VCNAVCCAGDCHGTLTTVWFAVSEVAVVIWMLDKVQAVVSKVNLVAIVVVVCSDWAEEWGVSSGTDAIVR